MNDVNIESYRHEQVIEALKSGGDVVTLTVKYFKPAAVFLNKSGDTCKTLLFAFFALSVLISFLFQ